MKLLDLAEHRVARARMATLDHIERILADPAAWFVSRCRVTNWFDWLAIVVGTLRVP